MSGIEETRKSISWELRNREFRDEHFKSVLSKYGCADLIPDLARVLNETYRFTEEITQALADTGEPKAYEILVAELMESGSKSSRCKSALISVGVSAEPYLWQTLKDGDSSDIAKACEVLGSIGTKRSNEHLTPLLNHDRPRVVDAAKSAIQKIEAAKRAPPAMSEK